METLIYGHVYKYQTRFCISRKLKKCFLVNNFCVFELQTLKFLTQKENMVMQMLAASPSPIFCYVRVMLKKITMFTFQKVVPNSPVKLKSLNQKLQLWVFQRQDFAFRAAINTSYRKITTKRLTFIYFLPLISLKTVLL